MPPSRSKRDFKWWWARVMLCAWAFLLVVILANRGVTVLAGITAAWVVIKIIELVAPPKKIKIKDDSGAKG